MYPSILVSIGISLFIVTLLAITLPIDRIMNEAILPAILAKKLGIPFATAKVVKQLESFSKKAKYASQTLDNARSEYKQVMTEVQKDMESICCYIEQHPEIPEEIRTAVFETKDSISTSIHHYFHLF